MNKYGTYRNVRFNKNDSIFLFIKVRMESLGIIMDINSA